MHVLKNLLNLFFVIKINNVQYSIQDKPDTLIVDFFAGSGTTAHAVNLLNVEDGGKCRCILVTNNEVSEAKEKNLLRASFKPNDAE